MKKIIIVLLSLSFSVIAFSQELELQKTFDLPGETEVGDIANFEYDESEGIYTLTYILKIDPGTVRVEQYLFDNDFNFIEDKKEELDANSATRKYPWWDYQGENFNSYVIYVDEKDRLYLKKKDLHFTYNWKKMIYSVKTSSKETLKLQNEDESRLFHYRNWWSEEDMDNIYILCGLRSDNDDNSYMKDFVFLKISKDLQVIKQTEVKFDYPQEVVFPRFVDDDIDAREIEMKKEIVCLFAPKNNGKKGTDPDAFNYTYVILNDNLDILHRVSFKPIARFWSVEDYVYDQQSSSCYLLGASVIGKVGDYYNDLKTSKKFDGFQIVRITDDKVEYIKNNSVQELLTKKVMPPSEKKTNSYEGKRFNIANYQVTPKGDLFVAGQNYDIHRSPSAPKYTTFEDCFAFGFNPSGEITGQYTFNWKGFGAMVPALQECFVGNDPSNVYWFIMQVAYVKIDIWGGFGPSWVDIYSSQISKVDLQENTMTDFTNHQVNKEAKKSYYLSSKMPYFLTPDNKLVLFGSQSLSGRKRLWFARIVLD